MCRCSLPTDMHLLKSATVTSHGVRYMNTHHHLRLILSHTKLQQESAKHVKRKLSSLKSKGLNFFNLRAHPKPRILLVFHKV